MSLPAKATVLLALMLLPVASAESFLTEAGGNEERDCVNVGEGPGNGGGAPSVSPTTSGYGVTVHLEGKAVALSVVPEECLPVIGNLTNLVLTQAFRPVDSPLLP